MRRGRRSGIYLSVISVFSHCVSFLRPLSSLSSITDHRKPSPSLHLIYYLEDTIKAMTMISLHRYLFSKSSQLISFKVLASASHANNTFLPPAPTSNLRMFSAALPNIEPTTRKRLDVAIVGLPNAGKSQLLNSLVGTKVAAVSRKRHTTRSGILAARTIENTQIVFVDTPGFMHHASTAREGVRQLAAHASSEMDEVDQLCAG